MRIVVDAFGGDNSPGEIIKGCAQALGAYSDFELILTGDEGRLRLELGELANYSGRVKLVHAPQVISCEEQPTVAIKKKKDSSLVKALELVALKEADCFVSAGSSGAVLAGATLIVRRLKGVKRPALAPILPTRHGCVLLIDCGANTDCKPSYLQQFAVMGSAYMKGVMQISEPRVGLINNGAEAEKGNDLTKVTYRLLENTPVRFAGNCEARDIVSGNYDVLVCDGFTGNVVLKFMEGLAGTLMGMLKDELTSTALTKIGAAICRPAFSRFKKKMDYTEYGGAPLLGINGGIIKAHGSSNAKAVCAAIRQARELVNGGVVEAIREGVAALPDSED